MSAFKYLIWLFLGLSLGVACSSPEPELNPSQMRYIKNMVRMKVDSVKRIKTAECMDQVVMAAIPKRDSILATFEQRVATDTITKPQKPQKPERPVVEIPNIED